MSKVNQFIFVMVKCGVLFEVRNEFLNIETSFGFSGLFHRFSLIFIHADRLDNFVETVQLPLDTTFESVVGLHLAADSSIRPRINIQQDAHKLQFPSVFLDVIYVVRLFLLSAYQPPAGIRMSCIAYQKPPKTCFKSHMHRELDSRVTHGKNYVK
jgi:hypothetical protein